MSADCQSFFTCANADMSFEELIRNLVVINEDGCPALRTMPDDTGSSPGGPGDPRMFPGITSASTVNGVNAAFIFNLPGGGSDDAANYSFMVYVDGQRLSPSQITSVVDNNDGTATVTVTIIPSNRILLDLYNQET